MYYVQQANNFVIKDELIVKAFPWICFLPGIYRLCEALSNTYSKLLPAVDLDGDKYKARVNSRSGGSEFTQPPFSASEVEGGQVLSGLAFF